ncbi:MAG: response regulator [Defluviitaleaceae bacterium]|nr:response regulator [Defluviitaleaceae bacterium]
MNTDDNKKFSILAIDDTPMQLKILTQMLSPLYDVRVATSGEKGIKLAQKHHIDLIFLDIIMEDMSGFEVLEQLKSSSKTASIPVVFTTSMEKDTAESEIKNLAGEAVDYITKPFEKEVVLHMVGLHTKSPNET